MSGRAIIIEIIPPAHDNIEQVVERGLQCPCCSRGKIVEWGIKENRVIDCSRCGGTGLLRARVTVEWEADE
jgi:DNA-directed RNA polymerase subunit RPC12/RpoP